MSGTKVIDLRSDTVTQPSDGMRAVMKDAEVGDDVFGEDPSVNALQERCAKMFGKEAALFVPTGTMANLLALLSQSRPGDTVLLHETGHAYNFEGGNVAAFGGLMTRLLPGPVGKIEQETVKHFLTKSDNPHFSQPAIVSLENTTNMGGGNVYTPGEFEELFGMTREAGVALHCDGARIMNACVAAGVEPVTYGQHVDTITCCFSKGLGAPVGSLLAGSAEVIGRALKYRKMLGGGMRQAGVLAVAASYALDNHLEGIAEDHSHARMFREALERHKEISFPFETPTNIVFFEFGSSEKLVELAEREGLRMLSISPGIVRVVFHRDVSLSDVQRSIEILGSLV